MMAGTWSRSLAMSNEILKLVQRVAGLESRVRGIHREGTVVEVDPGAGTLRLKLGEGQDGEPYLSARIPYAQTAGAMKFHNPPSVGQQMMAVSPDGDLRQAVAHPLGFSDDEVSPGSDGGSHVLTLGDVTMTVKGDGVTISVGGVSVAITASGLAVTGGEVSHNGTDTGDTHTHSGISPGPARTGTPK